MDKLTPRVPPTESVESIRERPTRVLLVDDQPMIGEAVRRMLAEAGVTEYRYCADPTKALALAHEFEPTIILSDLVMPQMDGLDLVRAFRADEATAQVPLIVLSSREEATTKAEAFALGANDYLVKLPDKIELVARVRHHSEGYIHLLQRDAAFAALEQSRQIMADDLDQAARYVLSLLPEPLEGKVETAWRFIPSASLGGDTFGYHWLDDARFVMYLLDVSGHGVGAALLSVSALNLLRTQALRHTDFGDPGKVLERLNDTFQMDEQGGKYFTIWYGVFDTTTRTLHYAGGGHPPALLFRGEGEPEQLSSTGPMPGALPGLRYETLHVQVPSGARILVFSDGVYELPDDDGHMRSYQDLVTDLVADGGKDPLSSAIERAERLTTGGEFPDDVSVVQLTFP